MFASKLFTFLSLTKGIKRSMAIVSEYGTWKSPITSAIATESTVSFQELHVDRAVGRTKGE